MLRTLIRNHGIFRTFIRNHGMLRTLAYLEPEAYSKPCQKSLMERFVELTATVIYANYYCCCDISFLMFST